jgi:hypothetical protein
VPTGASTFRPILSGVGLPTLFASSIFASGSTNLAETSDLVWAMVAISVAGSIVTFSFLVYAIWRFRDPKVKGRRYG